METRRHIAGFVFLTAHAAIADSESDFINALLKP
jgi:hypothetical protein